MTEKTIHLEYFAALRERRGRDGETLSTGAHTTGDLYEELSDRHDFELPRESLRVAVNDEFASWERELQSGDRVVFIPPVAGGR